MPLVFPLAVMRLRSDQAVQYKVSHAAQGMVRNGGKRAHQGWDLVAPQGTKVFAVGPGIVMWTLDDKSDKGYGKQVLLQFRRDGSSAPNTSTNPCDYYYAFYAHLSKISVKSGDFVKAGDSIGLSGISGNAVKVKEHPHLHFEIRDTSEKLGKGLDRRINPIEIFGRYLLSNNAAQYGGIDDVVHMVCRESTVPLPVSSSNNL